MKKTFRRALACLLAVLMVAFSMPLSALAFQAPTEGWWVAEYGENPALGAVQLPVNYKTLNQATYEAYGDDAGENYFGFADTLEEAIELEVDNRSEYKPFVALTLSSLGNNTDMANSNFREQHPNYATDYYGGSAKKSYSEAINMLNPADQLHAGDRIAVTFEFGGFDALNTAQIKGKFNNTKITPASYTNNTIKKLSDSWTRRTGSIPTAWATTATNYGYSEAFSAAGANVNSDFGTFYIATVTVNQSFGLYTPQYLLGSTTATYGEFGYIAGSIQFEVLEDCYIADVISLDTDTSGTLFEIGDRFWTSFDGTEQGSYRINGSYIDDRTVAQWIPVWTNVTSSTPDPEPTHEHNYDYANAQYTWKADNTACSAVATCVGTVGTCDATTVTANATNVSASADTANCTNGGQITYTATFASPFATQTKTVDTDAKGHTFTGDVAHYVDGTIDKHAATCIVCGAKDTDNGVACTMEKQDTSIEPTCTTGGNYVFKCSGCGYSVEQSQNATGIHINDYTDVAYTWADDNSTCTATIGCQTCDGTAATVTVDANRSGGSAANCQQTADTTYTATFADANLTTQTNTVTGAAGPHDYDYANAVYTWDGTTACSAVAKCKYCTATTTDDATGVTSAEKTAATCTVKGTTTYTAAFAAPFADQTKDVQDIATVRHNMVQTAAEIPATVDAPGKTAVKECSFNCGTTEGGVEIPQLAHYVVTATAQNGTATVNDKATANIAPMGNVTLVATPASDDLTFVGWSLNDKIVSENTTYVTKAIADADYVAVFALAETNNASSTAVFTDEYSNVYDTQEVAYGEFATAPADPSFVGFTFAGWSVDGEIVDVATTAINENTTFVAVFERAATAQYTITVAEGCQINGEALTSKDFDYNDICTVTAPEGSVNGVWKVGDAVVGYGTSYTFFVGASATLTYVENESVAATPVVVAVSVERSEDATGVDFAFLATRTTPAGYTYVNAGFVYGKNMTDADLDLDNVGDKGSNGNSGIVKVVYCSTGVEQFRLTYGLSTKGSVASAKAFLAYTDGTGTHVIYGTFDAQTY